MLRHSTFWLIYITILLTTEFFYISVGGGTARIYHFLTIFSLLLLGKSLNLLFKSGVFCALLAFVGVNVFAASLSDDPERAFASLTSLLANIGISASIALMLLKGKVSPDRLLRWILVLTLISVFWGLMQILAFKSGLVLALSPQQKAQIWIGFGPGFRTEANTFGKYMLLPFLFFLPFYLRKARDRKLGFVYLILAIGIFMNFTRSALYGLLLTAVFIFFWYFAHGRLSRISSRSLKIIGTTALGITLILSGMVDVSDYAKYKMENFFNREEMTQGGSSAYRLDAMEAVIDNTIHEPKRLLIGNGWGQTYTELQGRIVQAGGGDTVNVLGFGGLLGVLFYLVYSYRSFRALAHVASYKGSNPLPVMAEGFLFAFVAMFITGQMTGFIITPEYWLLIGVCIFIDIVAKQARYQPRAS